jgi:hypothetical protein
MGKNEDIYYALHELKNKSKSQWVKYYQLAIWGHVSGHTISDFADMYKYKTNCWVRDVIDDYDEFIDEKISIEEWSNTWYSSEVLRIALTSIIKHELLNKHKINTHKE